MVWTSAAESMLTRWAEKAKYYQILHEQAAQKAETMDKTFGLPIVVIGVLCNSVGYVGNFMDLSEKTISMWMGATSVLLTLVVAVGRQVGYKQIYAESMFCANGFEKIALEIEEQLCRDPQDRSPCLDFVARLKTDMQTYSKKKIPDSVFQKYIKDVDTHFRSMGIDVAKYERKSVRIIAENPEAEKMLSTSQKVKTRPLEKSKITTDLERNSTKRSISNEDDLIDIENENDFTKKLYENMKTRSHAFASNMV